MAFCKFQARLISFLFYFWDENLVSRKLVAYDLTQRSLILEGEREGSPLSTIKYKYYVGLTTFLV